MRRLGPLVVVALFASGAACDAVTSPGAEAALVGRWTTPPERVGGTAAGVSTQSLEFGSGRQYRAEWRSAGVYPGQPAGELSSYSRAFGAYRTDGDRLLVAVDSVVVWDRFYGAASPERVERPARTPGPEPDMRFEVAGDRLTLRYLSYPADAPVPTTAIYRRAP